MAQDKQFRRMEAKIDALLEKAGIDVASFDTQQQTKQERKLTPQEQDALNNAPKPRPDLRGVPAENDETSESEKSAPRSQGKK